MRRFLLRWRVDYSNGRPTKYGIWNMHSHIHTDNWSAQPKDHILFGAIEAKNIETYEVKIVVAVDGWNLCNFQWVDNFSYNNRTSTKCGLKIVTRDKYVTAFIDGVVKEEPRPDFDLDRNYESYGK